MALVGSQKTVIHPREGGNFLIRALTGDEVDEAKDVEVEKQLANLHKMGDALKYLNDVQRGGPTDPLAGYDKATVIRFGLQGWPYEAELTPATKEDSGSRGRLDAFTRDWLCREILNMSLIDLGEGSASSTEFTPRTSTAQDSPAE